MPVKKKKVTRKKSIRKRKPVDAKPENYFILVTGVPLKNVKELANSLETMNDWVFNHHVNPSRNDFSAWIGAVLKERALGDEIKEVNNIKDMEIKLLKHLVNKYL